MCIEQDQKERNNRFITTLDPLTDLPNRSSFFDFLDGLVAKENTDFVIFLIDIDGFKNLTNTLGYVWGDNIISMVGRRLKDCSEYFKDMFIARMGGDEYVLVYPNITQRKHITDIANHIIRCMSYPYEINGKHLELTVSMGGVAFPTDADNVNDLIRYVDIALYAAKKNGKNRFELFTEELDEVFRKRQIIAEQLKHCIEFDNDAFYLVYQPKINTMNGTVMGMEALLRWKVDGELIPPSVFIPIAEEIGIMGCLGGLVLKKAAIFAKSLLDCGKSIQVAVNVSPCQFDGNDLERLIKDVILEVGLPPKNLQLEITESFMTNKKEASVMFDRLRKIGITIAIDDFGTGYSSLSYLKDFPVDVLKLDQSFIKQISSGDTRLVEAVVSIADSLELDLIAEGVESETELEFLETQNVNLIQGYYFSKPLDQKDFVAFLGTAIPDNKFKKYLN